MKDKSNFIVSQVWTVGSLVCSGWTGLVCLCFAAGFLTLHTVQLYNEIKAEKHLNPTP